MFEFKDIPKIYLSTFKLIETLKIQKKHQQILEICDQYLGKLIPNNVTIIFLCWKADVLLVQHELEKAKSVLNYAYSIDNNNVVVNYLLGCYYSLKCDWDQSLKYLKKIKNSQKYNVELLRQLGWVTYQKAHDLQDEKLKKKGINLLIKALNINSNDVNTLEDLGVAHMQEKQFTKSINYFKRAIQIDPNNTHLNSLLTHANFFKENCF